MLEDHVEKTHQDMDTFHQRVARLRSYEMRANSYSHHEKTVNDPEVFAAGKEAMEKTSRKRGPGPTLAETRGSAKKEAKNIQRSEDHAAQKMRPPGEAIQPHEMSKQDHKNNSIQH
jgi:hypothetical protein